MLRMSLLLALVLTATIALFAQLPSSPFCNSGEVPNASGTGCHPPTADEVSRQKRLDKERNKQRYQDMKRDSERLLQLATELKKEVDSASAETLSLDVVKKADSIEKLAHSVKEKMKGD